MKSIPLTQNKIAYVDDEDFEELSKHKWFAHNVNGYWYAGRVTTTAPYKRKRLYMHRIIMNPPINMLIDHRDGNGFNNQKSNLRICTHSQNHANHKLQKSNKTGYNGVYFHKDSNKYHVDIQKDLIRYYVGLFNSLEDAARAYDEMAIKLHGEFARLNFPNKKEKESHG